MDFKPFLFDKQIYSSNLVVWFSQEFAQVASPSKHLVIAFNTSQVEVAEVLAMAKQLYSSKI